MKPKACLRILLVFLLSFLVFSCLKEDELLENPKNEILPLTLLKEERNYNRNANKHYDNVN